MLAMAYARTCNDWDDGHRQRAGHILSNGSYRRTWQGLFLMTEQCANEGDYFRRTYQGKEDRDGG